jgi:riboflavin synthase
MFTGIIEELGTLVRHHAGHMEIQAPKIAKEAAIGDSISTNGICLTLTSKQGNTFTVDYSRTTRDITTLSAWRVGEALNLEQALTLGTRIGGHLVAGHVDGVGRIIALQEREGVHLSIQIPETLTRSLIPKGSIAVDGVSLTVVAVHEGHFDLTLIPHSLASTNLQGKRVGDRVNIETDLLGKYVERLLARGAAPQMSFEELARQGF